MNTNHFMAIVLGTIFGFFARFYMLKVDYRQYPSYPHGYITHLTFGLVGAALGSLFIPALLKEDYVAVTFLALAAQQFRDIRKIERESLMLIEETEIIPRGAGYIEGIAKLFEARNYLAMSVAFIVTASSLLAGAKITIIVGTIAIVVANKIIIGEKIEDIAVVCPEEIIFLGANLRVGEEVMLNIGDGEAREVWQNRGLALSIEPIDDNARITLSNKGQRQAILHEVASQLGVRVDTGIQDFNPLIRIEMTTGRLLLLVVPNEPDRRPLIDIVKKTPLIETAIKKPLNSQAGREAAD